MSTDSWRKLRRAAHTGFNVQAARTYQPVQAREAAVLTRHLLRDADGWIHHIRRYVSLLQSSCQYLYGTYPTQTRSIASVVLSIVYGWPSLDESSDPLVERMDNFMHRLLTAAMPGKFLVEVFPVMLLLPTWLASWKRWALDWHQKDTKLFENLLDTVRNTEVCLPVLHLHRCCIACLGLRRWTKDYVWSVSA